MNRDEVTIFISEFLEKYTICTHGHLTTIADLLYRALETKGLTKKLSITNNNHAIDEKKIIPGYCHGTKCMLDGCTNLAAHKVTEENAYNKVFQTEEYSIHNNCYPLSTYICEEHFIELMTRNEVYGTKDNRNFGNALNEELKKTPE